MRMAIRAQSGARLWRWSRLTAAALLPAALTGCAVRPFGVQPSGTSAAVAPDLFDLTGLTPAAGPSPAAAGRAPGSADSSVSRTTAPPSRRPDDPALGSGSSPAVATGTAGRGATPSAPVPTPEAIGRTAAVPPATIPLSSPPYPIDLTTALRLADVENPTIAEARVAILAALAEQQAARSLLLPSLNAGANYHGHDGNLQRSSGRILRLSEQSFYVGGGTRTLAAESVAIPAVSIVSPLTDAIFEPLAARQRVAGARLNAAATGNSVLLEVAKLFLELLGAEARLESRRLSASQAAEIVKIVADYAATGQGRKADADRADSDLRMLQGEIQRTEEEVAVTSARLSRRLNLDPGMRLQTVSGPLAPIDLIDASVPPEELVRSAIGRRPDLGARSALIGLAEYKLKEERARPLLPTIWMGFSGGGFGGGSNLTPPLLGNFAGRTDFDVRAYWTLLNFGAGNAALIKRRQAEVGQAVAERGRVLNQVRSEVASARAEALAQGRQIDVARAELVSAEDGFREDFLQLRETVGLPIEVLDSLKLLVRARLNLIEAITRANQSQFALYVALGSPPPLDQSSPAPSAPPPIATPLGSPIRRPNREPTPRVSPPGPPILGR